MMVNKLVFDGAQLFTSTESVNGCGLCKSRITCPIFVAQDEDCSEFKYDIRMIIEG